MKRGSWDHVLVRHDVLFDFVHRLGVAVIGATRATPTGGSALHPIVRVAAIRIVEIRLGKVQVMQSLVVLHHVTRRLRNAPRPRPREYLLFALSLLLCETKLLEQPLDLS